MHARLWTITFTPTVVLPAGMPNIVKVRHGYENADGDAAEIRRVCREEEPALTVAFCNVDKLPPFPTLASTLFCSSR